MALLRYLGQGMKNKIVAFLKMMFLFWATPGLCTGSFIFENWNAVSKMELIQQVLEAVRACPFLVTLHYAFQTDAKLHLILGKYN